MHYTVGRPLSCLPTHTFRFVWTVSFWPLRLSGALPQQQTFQFQTSNTDAHRHEQFQTNQNFGPQQFGAQTVNGFQEDPWFEFVSSKFSAMSRQGDYQCVLVHLWTYLCVRVLNAFILFFLVNNQQNPQDSRFDQFPININQGNYRSSSVTADNGSDSDRNKSMLL